MDGRTSVRVVAFCLVLLALVAMFGIALVAYGGEGGGDGPPARASDLFEATKVWSVHLRFTPEQWAKMEPKEERLSVERPAFGTGMLLAPAMMRDGDKDRDRSLSSAEFRAWASIGSPPGTGTATASSTRRRSARGLRGL